MKQPQHASADEDYPSPSTPAAEHYIGDCAFSKPPNQHPMPQLFRLGQTIDVDDIVGELLPVHTTDRNIRSFEVNREERQAFVYKGMDGTYTVTGILAVDKKKKVLKLITTGCVTQLITRTNVPSATKATIEPMQVNVYPNPSTSAFQMFVKTPSTSKIAMRILDIQGRLIKTISFNSDETIAFGNDLKSGVYMVELREGNVIKTVRVVKY